MKNERDNQITLAENQATGAMELTGLRGETEVSMRIIEAIADDSELIDYVALYIAHNRAEQTAHKTGQNIGQVIVDHIQTTYVEIHDRLQSTV